MQMNAKLSCLRESTVSVDLGAEWVNLVKEALFSKRIKHEDNL